MKKRQYHYAAVAVMVLVGVAGCATQEEAETVDPGPIITTNAYTDVPEAERASQTVLHEGSEVDVYWSRANKTRATLVHHPDLTISDIEAAALISEATGCDADPGMTTFDTEQRPTMAIQCQ